MPSRAQFLDKYEFPLEFEHDFAIDGKPAQWASMHPKDWLFQDKVTNGQRFFIELPKKMFKKEPAYTSVHSTMSPDKKLLAVSTSTECIAIYDIESLELRQELEGCGKLHFRPSPTVDDGDSTSVGKPSYTLVSSVTYDGERGAVDKNTLILWELDRNGRLLIEEEPIDTATYATKAIESILPELVAKHEWSKDFVESSNLHAQFEKALTTVSADHCRRHNTTLNDARLSSFSAFPFSSDGKYMLYSSENKSTQSGMREPDELPQVNMYEMDTGKDVLNLRGHTDYIAWASFSPDDQYIATVSWDGTMRMYHAQGAVAGTLAWATENSGGQCWSADFSPNSEYIVWSSKSGGIVKVHAVSDGSVVSTFDQEFRHWCRSMTWHPDGQQIALYVDRQAWVWRPFDGAVAQHFQMKVDEHRFASIANVKWLKEGHSLALSFNEGSLLVWDSETNSKELHRRPKGLRVPHHSDGPYYIIHGEQEHEEYVSVDGDGWIRFHRLAYPETPSWWEKEEAKEEEGEVKEKEAYPPTGKYVNVTVKPKKEDKARDAWAEKGADLWTAE